MELSRAQLLVHEDEAIESRRRSWAIPSIRVIITCAYGILTSLKRDSNDKGPTSNKCKGIETVASPSKRRTGGTSLTLPPSLDEVLSYGSLSKQPLGGGLGRNEGFIGDAASSKPSKGCSHLRPYERAVKRAKAGWDANYVTTTQAQNEATTARVERDKALKDLAKLQVVTYGPDYKRIFNRGIIRAGDDYEKQVVVLCPQNLRGRVACLPS
ncbi:hypothetical protein Acr_00g0020900 [Actinidia rufa]|uniref:Uncharacterized protein n=1 Tax=Actinidia rufa TaxID=165716 RepID=A0A7J0DC44_9ERIC|nr:hypothetical protein Acr_00g0020900 [Actinidia rufa]